MGSDSSAPSDKIIPIMKTVIACHILASADFLEALGQESEDTEFDGVWMTPMDATETDIRIERAVLTPLTAYALDAMPPIYLDKRMDVFLDRERSETRALFQRLCVYLSSVCVVYALMRIVSSCVDGDVAADGRATNGESGQEPL
jgi:hypothetical protein